MNFTHTNIYVIDILVMMVQLAHTRVFYPIAHMPSPLPVKELAACHDGSYMKKHQV